MQIGIDASRAFLSRRTGIEEYSYRVIRHLRAALAGEEVVLYTRKTFVFEGIRPRWKTQEPDFDLPPGWTVRPLFAPRFFTHGRLAAEMLFRPPEVFFIPAHTVPFIRPKRTVVVIHGLEYEFFPEGYSRWERFYMRTVIRFSCRAASRVVAVSENTKRDVMRLYGVPEGKVTVVYEGKPDTRSRTTESISNFEFRISKREPKTIRIGKKPYLLFVGRIEERKNISRIVEAFGILKERYGIPHRLVLVGKPGYGYGRIRRDIGTSPYADDIVETGYVTEEERVSLLRQADAFLFPTLYEGFGLPVVEAQVEGIPVVTSDVSSLPEVGGDGAVLVDPTSGEAIAEGIRKVLSDDAFRDDIMEKGRKNAERFDWDLCAEELATVLRA